MQLQNHNRHALFHPDLLRRNTLYGGKCLLNGSVAEKCFGKEESSSAGGIPTVQVLIIQIRWAVLLPGSLLEETLLPVC